MENTVQQEPKTSVKKVALLIETTRSYTRDILSGVRRYIHTQGPWSTFLELRALDSSVPPWLANWDGDGILSRTYTKGMAAAIASTGLPTVELRSTVFGKSLPFVGMDNALIGTRVADHFINRGYQNFAAYTLDNETFFVQRFKKFVTTVEDMGRVCHQLPAVSETELSDWEQHQEFLISWLESLPKPIGIMAANDQLAVRILDACQRANLFVPDEVAVVGCENEKTLCEFASPPLSSLEFDGEAVGYQAASLLGKMMAGESVDQSPLLIPPRDICIRASSDQWAIDDPIVLRAMRLIRSRACLGLQVSEVCESVGVSRSTLERRMKAVLRRGAKAEILRIRFQEVNRLLRNTNMTIEAICEQTAFRHPHYFQTAYREKFGQTPGEYRKANRDFFS